MSNVEASHEHFRAPNVGTVPKSQSSVAVVVEIESQVSQTLAWLNNGGFVVWVANLWWKFMMRAPPNREQLTWIMNRMFTTRVPFCEP